MVWVRKPKFSLAWLQVTDDQRECFPFLELETNEGFLRDESGLGNYSQNIVG